MKLFFLFVILVQVWTALGTRCRTNGGPLGICKLLNECNVQYENSQLLAKCANTGLHCCPNQSRVSLPTSKVSSVDPVPVTLPTTPRVPVQTNQATFTLATRSKFPTDCGDTPKYPKVQIVGGKEIKPDEYSWLASLQYGNNVTVGSCGASVINSRYLLTAAHCVTGSRVRRAGGLTRLRLGDFNVKDFCDYGTANCTIYQEFRIEQIIPHSEYTSNLTHLFNDIALLRVDRPIQFGPKMKPICLPFGENDIPEPEVGSIMTVAGWGLTMVDNEKPAKRDVSIQLWDTKDCNRIFHVDERHLCAAETGKNSCNGDSGGPLMYEFDKRRMVLEGLVSYGVQDCKDNNYPGVYTRVRHFYNWLNQKMVM